MDSVLNALLLVTILFQLINVLLAGIGCMVSPAHEIMEWGLWKLAMLTGWAADRLAQVLLILARAADIFVAHP